MTSMARAIVIVGLLLGCGCKTAPLKNPGPIAVACGETAKMQNAIHEALRKRGWAVGGAEPGKVFATLYLREHVAEIVVEYTAEEFSIKYIDSQKLMYTKSRRGKERIHGNYNDWIQYLVNDIKRIAAAKNGK